MSEEPMSARRADMLAAAIALGAEQWIDWLSEPVEEEDEDGEDEEAA